MTMSAEDLILKITTLKAASDTLRRQIKELSTFYNVLQVRMWRKQRAKINRKMKYYKAKLKSMQ